ncbi:hypothetical protein C8R47DRAFT_1193902 [Mycena vitilis]|nr:hypothetical protein C8R47DRAFT_1193902 [Mycena vitilis]
MPGRCNVVRYCSKSCQRADWSEHKLYCQISPIMDIGEWMEVHEALFRWALIEGLDLRSEPSNILRDGLWVQMKRMDRLVKGISPSPFFVESTSPLLLSDMNKLVEANIFPPKESRAIIKAGGIGKGVVVFNVSSGPGGPDVWRVQYHDIFEKLSGPTSASNAAWQGIVKGVVNGTIPISSISRGIEAAPTSG